MTSSAISGASAGVGGLGLPANSRLTTHSLDSPHLVSSVLIHNPHTMATLYLPPPKVEPTSDGKEGKVNKFTRPTPPPFVVSCPALLGYVDAER